MAKRICVDLVDRYLDGKLKIVLTMALSASGSEGNLAFFFQIRLWRKFHWSRLLLLDLEKFAKVTLVQHFIQKSTASLRLWKTVWLFFYLCTCLITLAVCDFITVVSKSQHLKMNHMFFPLRKSYSYGVAVGAELLWWWLHFFTLTWTVLMSTMIFWALGSSRNCLWHNCAYIKLHFHVQ